MANRNRTNFLGRALDALVAARTRQAERYVNGALLTLDDETLASLGHSRSELMKRPHTPMGL